jgi:predicted DCC family thiol-disulfide oxidoreductase YuxK
MQNGEGKVRPAAARGHPVVLFDGVCKFCNAGVNFIIDHDPRARLRFAALQSETGQSLLRQFGMPTKRLSTLVLVEGGRHYVKSTAALRICGHLSWPWPVLVGALFVPSFLRDAGYDLLAGNRYRWFGQLDACRVPTPEVRQRFLG